MSELVSILIPLYNAEKTIEAALLSCVKQSYQNIEIIVLNNASSDQSLQRIENLKDDRIRVLQAESNLGIAKSRNTLLKEAKGSLIAWLDADDRMFENRIAEQVSFLQQHAEVDVLGTWVVTQDQRVRKAPLIHREIEASLWFKNCLFQPSMMSRNFYQKEAIAYNENLANSVEDYELWYRLRTKKTFANLPLTLTHYHLSEGEALAEKKANTNFTQKINELWKIKWKALNTEIAEHDQYIFQSFLYENKKLNESETKSLLHTLNGIQNSFKSETSQIICAFHTLRVWRNAQFISKIKHLGLLIAIRKYPQFKALGLR